MPFTHGAKATLVQSLADSLGRGEKEIRTDHILRALLEPRPADLAHRIARRAGIDPADASARLRQI